MTSSYQSSISLQTQKPSISSVTLGLAGSTDPTEARYWAQHFNLGGDIPPSLQKYASPKSLTFSGPSSSSLIHQVLFGPPAFGASSPLAVVSGPRIGLYGTSSETSSLNRAIRSVKGITIHHHPSLEPDRKIGTGGHPALCASYRADGRLVGLGTNHGHVRVADATSRANLATFVTSDNHMPIRTLAWLRNGKQLVAAGDDGKARLWSLDTFASDKRPILTFTGHGDSIRSCVILETDDGKRLITGSYDHTIRVWNLDVQNREEVECMGIMNHNNPVEALLVMESKEVETPWLISAGATELKVWNFKSGLCVSTLPTMHSKTITSLVCMKRSIEGTTNEWRILTAALDGLIRIHTWSASQGQLKFIHGVKLPDPITSLAFNETYTRFAIGTSTGNIMFRQQGASHPSRKRKQDPPAGTYAFFTRGQNAVAKIDDFSVTESKKRKLAAFDVALRQFRYGDALDQALATRQYQSVFAVLEELGRRRGLVLALSNRDEESLEPILSFTVRYITRPQYSSLMIGISNILCDIYGNVTGQSEIIDELFGKLKKQIHEEIVVQKSLLRLSGMLGTLIVLQQQNSDS
jgi:U3 small nucleolar RNA-associated protein 15